LLGQTLAALTQGQFRKSLQLATCLHLSASIRRKHPFLPSPNLQGCESPLTSLISEGNPFPVQSSCIVSREFRENLEWAVVVPGDREISPAVTELLGDSSQRGITIHHSRFGPW
jgi:hypothetical protein